MKLSVHIITFNDQNNIVRALESALSQDVDFDYEIVVGDDASTDGTRDILIDFKKRFPERFRLLLHEKNFGDKGKQNFVQTLEACRGEYVALLPGDDYWSSPLKLKRQVAFLDSHPAYSACFHNVLEIDDSDPPNSRVFCDDDWKAVLTLEDLMIRNYIPTCAVVFRNNLFGKIPAWFYRGFPGDWFLHILNAEHGPIGYIDELMGVYRRQPGGAWTTLGPEKQLLLLLEAYELIDKHLRGKYHEVCSQSMRKLSRELSYIYLRRFHDTARGGRFRQALPWLKPAVKYDPNLLADPWQYAYFFKSCVLSMRMQVL